MKEDVEWIVSRGRCRFSFVVCILDGVCCILLDVVGANASTLLHDRQAAAVHIVAIDLFIVAIDDCCNRYDLVGNQLKKSESINK